MADKPHDRKSPADQTPDPEHEDELYAIADEPAPVQEPPSRKKRQSYESPVEPATKPPSDGESATESTATPTEQAAPPKRPGKAKAEPAGDPVHCHNHPKEVGKWFCKVCNMPVCRECVRIDEDPKLGRPVAYCLKCDVPCAINKQARHRDEYDNSPFLARLGRAFAYPMHGHNAIILLMLAIPFIALFLLAVPMPFVLLALPVFLIWPIVPWLYDILAESARGNRDLPNVTVMADPVDEVLRPLFFFIAAAVAAFLPALLVGWLMPENSLQQTLTSVLWFAGVVLLPMLLLITVLFESPLAIRPSMIFAAIRHMGLDYVVYLIIMVIVPAIAFGALSAGGPLAAIVGVPLMLYFLALNMHLLGQLYHAHRHELGWFV